MQPANREGRCSMRWFCFPLGGGCHPWRTLPEYEGPTQRGTLLGQLKGDLRFLLLLLDNLFERVREKRREKEIFHLLVCSLNGCNGLAQTRSLELHLLGLPCGCQGTKHWACFCCFLQHISRDVLEKTATNVLEKTAVALSPLLGVSTSSLRFFFFGCGCLGFTGSEG